MSNVREGFSRKDDTFPKKWLEPITTSEGEERRLTDYYQTTILTKADLEQMLDNYYDERGWDKETGEPTPEKLKELGLEGS